MPKVCLLPGWGFSPAVFAPLLAALPETWEGVALPCAPEAGENFIAWARRLAPCVPQGSVLLGWSLGAQLALALAAEGAPASRLVALAATPRFTAATDWPAGLAQATVEQFSEGWRHDREKTRKRFLALQAVGETTRGALIARLAGHLLPVDAPGLSEGLALLAEADLRELAARVRLPTLLIHGDGDALMPVEASRWLATTIPGAQRLVLAGRGHAALLSAPGDVAAAIVRFTGNAS